MREQGSDGHLHRLLDAGRDNPHANAEAIAEPTQAWQAMGDGFRVGVRIVTGSIEQAVQVPVGALFPHGEAMAVYRLDGRRARLQAVEVAARNATMAWVRKGLEPSQLVVVYPPASLADGRNVRVRSP
jgi:HlyD family secretion protein